jgi:hypothetical protein
MVHIYIYICVNKYLWQYSDCETTRCNQDATGTTMRYIQSGVRALIVLYQPYI